MTVIFFGLKRNGFGAEDLFGSLRAEFRHHPSDSHRPAMENGVGDLEVGVNGQSLDQFPSFVLSEEAVISSESLEFFFPEVGVGDES
jgi:hypothetical protein